MGERPCDQCGSTKNVRFIPDPDCNGVHSWYACEDCRAEPSNG